VADFGGKPLLVEPRRHLMVLHGTTTSIEEGGPIGLQLLYLRVGGDLRVGDFLAVVFNLVVHVATANAKEAVGFFSFIN
jgi:hypothetical protein